MVDPTTVDEVVEVNSPTKDPTSEPSVASKDVAVQAQGLASHRRLDRDKAVKQLITALGEHARCACVMYCCCFGVTRYIVSIERYWAQAYHFRC